MFWSSFAIWRRLPIELRVPKFIYLKNKQKNECLWEIEM